MRNFDFKRYTRRPKKLLRASLSGLYTSNLCRPTRVAKLKLVCVNDTKTCWQTVGKKLARIETSSICRQRFANLLLCPSHTPVSGLPRCKNLTRFSLFVSFCFAVRYCLKCFCFLCFPLSVSFTGSYTEVKPQFQFANTSWPALV